MIRHLSSLSDPFFGGFILRSLLWLVRLLRCVHALGKYTSPKRRIETDVMKLYVPSTLALRPQAELVCHPSTSDLVVAWHFTSFRK